MSANHLVAKIEDILEILAHPVMFNGQKDGVEDDAEGDDDVEDGVIDDDVEKILNFDPAGVVKTAGLTAGTVSVIARL